MSKTLEGRLVKPPEFLLPKKGITHMPHPLLELAIQTTSKALQNQEVGTYSIQDAVERNKLLLVAQRSEEYEQFVGKLVSSDLLNQFSNLDWTIAQLLKGTPLYPVGQFVAAYDGRVIPSRLRGLIFPEHLADQDDTQGITEKKILAKYLNPDKLIQNPKEPQLFTFSSAFNNAASKWHFHQNSDYLDQLSPYQQQSLLNDFIDDGLEVLESEVGNKYISQAAKRLQLLRKSGRIAVNIALNRPEPDGRELKSRKTHKRQ